MNAIPIDRGRMAVAAIRNALSILSDGEALLVFPEGTRSQDGLIQDGKAGIGMIAYRSRVPIVPLFLSGAHNVLPRGSRIPKMCRVTAAFGRPLFFADLLSEKAGQDVYEKISERVMRELKNQGLFLGKIPK